jgi:hypothetical protein
MDNGPKHEMFGVVAPIHSSLSYKRECIREFKRFGRNENSEVECSAVEW